LSNYELRNINEDEGVMAQIRTQRTAETANIMATVTKQYLPVIDSPAFVRMKSAYFTEKKKKKAFQYNKTHIGNPCKGHDVCEMHSSKTVMRQNLPVQSAPASCSTGQVPSTPVS
jgi:DNA replicative helicase MCM subunit Mcm2 (Cdc46/Mcm family)